MKYIKKFEYAKDRGYVIGDVILCKYENKDSDTSQLRKLKDFINNTYGIIISLPAFDYIYVKYENIPDDVKRFFDDEIRQFRSEDVVGYAKTAEELDLKLQMKKYNV